MCVIYPTLLQAELMQVKRGGRESNANWCLGRWMWAEDGCSLLRRPVCRLGLSNLYLDDQVAPEPTVTSPVSSSAIGDWTNRNFETSWQQEANWNEKKENRQHWQQSPQIIKGYLCLSANVAYRLDELIMLKHHPVDPLIKLWNTTATSYTTLVMPLQQVRLLLTSNTPAYVHRCIVGATFICPLEQTFWNEHGEREREVDVELHRLDTILFIPFKCTNWYQLLRYSLLDLLPLQTPRKVMVC